MSQVTKRALVASLKNQLLKKPLDKVTISDITDDWRHQPHDVLLSL